MSKILFIVGHGKSETGGYDSGAVNGNYHEFKIAREIAKYAQEYYNKNYTEQCDLMNYDGDLYLQDRINKLQDNTYSMIAEFHLNAFQKNAASGSEVYYYHGDESGKKQAAAISSAIATKFGIPNRGAKTKLLPDGRDYFGIIRETKPQALLIETVYIDNDGDLAHVKTSAGQKTCGETIAKALAIARGAKKKTTTPTTPTTPTEPTTPTTKVESGDVVSIASGATYYNGKAVPSWVRAKQWVVDSVNGDRAIINKSSDGANAIYSPINTKHLTVVKEANPTNGFEPYKVQITANSLHIRKGAGTQYAVVGYINDKGVYTIVNEKDGWGKLKSGAGWISLYYTKRV